MTPGDRAILDRLLEGELDTAYRRRARALLDYLDVQDGENVLDGGCGMGFYLLALSRLRRARLVGVDSDPKRLAQARAANIPAALIRGDVENLSFADATFDKVLLSEVLEHVDSDVAGLAEAFRILRPGGVVAISTPHANYPFSWDPINRARSALGLAPIRSGPLAGVWAGHQRLYTPEQLVRLVIGAGFRVERVEEATHYSVPLSHFLLYGVGKPLLESGMLPASIRASVDRLSVDRRPGPLVKPVQRLLLAVDTLNDSPAAEDKRTFVNVLLKARKPRD